MPKHKTNSAVRGRWAPSPTGLLHVGSARTALVAWLSCRSSGGTFVWRTEDLDRNRSIEGMEERAMEDLAWLGLNWDEGPDCGGDRGPYRQSLRSESYNAALLRLLESDRLFPCRLSRSDLRDIANAPSGIPSPYPASLRPQSISADWFSSLDDSTSVRFAVNAGPTRFFDNVFGEQTQTVADYCGDFVVRRKDGFYSYQLAVVVDDQAMAISEIVRGSDLLDSTARQVQLYESLHAPIPAFAHVPIAIDPGGEKLSKKHGSLTISSLRDMGVRPEVLCGILAHSLGLQDLPDATTPLELVSLFNWAAIRKSNWVVGPELPRQIADRRFQQ